MSEYTFTKDDDLKLGDVLGCCFNDFERDPKSLNNKINLDTFKNNFSSWDGFYRPLEKMIKASMNDDSSYKHVSTVYHLILNKEPHAIVKTTFRGTNSYGGVVKQIVAARVDVRTGDVVSILDN
ncbi:putative prophage protein [Erwinia tracheiphila PSU-1]|nr:putative prophage protein [Erwinia tracheiphila PSU-1]